MLDGYIFFSDFGVLPAEIKSKVVTANGKKHRASCVKNLNRYCSTSAWENCVSSYQGTANSYARPRSNVLNILTEQH